MARTYRKGGVTKRGLRSSLKPGNKKFHPDDPRERALRTIEMKAGESRG